MRGTNNLPSHPWEGNEGWACMSIRTVHEGQAHPLTPSHEWEGEL
jgi:hypothetical protein